ncbi:SDR family NAD(P)-dependent oxidoreductase [Sphaerisporangium fuscum]|uniref:SDR family NAD(P)-dependent oxidoreductase n=1 Tax=Sphaerisporangium fuscum TaxID=2835868 RepID=UPI001BDC1F77|nr:SDR family oxidoreductase [Sphaerisporangium fuscum]
MTTTVIVTGGSSGIGRGVCERLGRKGWNVAVAYRHGADRAAETATVIREGGGAAIAVRADVTRRSDVGALFDRAQEAFGGIDALVTCAGASAVRSVADSDDALVAEQIGVNLLGSLYCMQEAAGRLRPGGGIVNVSSSAVAVGFPGLGLTLAAKAGVEALTRVLAKELGSRGVRVNAVAPGLLDTPTFRAGKTDQDLRRMADQVPLRRLGEVEEVAEAIVHLLSPEASWVNAQVLRVNGGYL